MTVSDVHVAKQRCVLAEAAWSAQRHHRGEPYWTKGV